MLDQRPTVFRTNPNKDFLRNEYDFAHVERWCRKKGRRLKYLGLPASEMLDISAWEQFLARFTTIEREENQQHLMFLRANVRDIEHRLYSLYGEFDQILLTGRDRYGSTPEWPYDLFNLDYFGGLLYSDFSRPQAIKKLVSNQANFQQDFILIITEDLRDGDTIGEKLSFLTDLRRSLKGATTDSQTRSKVDKLMDWYTDATTPDFFRQALYMNTFLRDSGEAAHFDVECRPAILYAGTTKARMVHFVTDFVFCKGISHKAVSKQNLLQLINLGTREVKDGKFVKPARVAPTFAA
jgi:hypothetical protein